jgi:hypothetical protein
MSASHKNDNISCIIFQLFSFVIFMPPQHLLWYITKCVRVCVCWCVCVCVCWCVCVRACVRVRVYYINYIVNLKQLLVKNHESIFNQLGKIVPWVKAFQIYSNLIPCRNMVAIATKRIHKNKFKKNLFVKTYTV